MSADGRLRMNHDEVTGKVIDGEAVIINVVTGRYYSLEEASCVAWVHLTAGASTDDVVTAVTERYDADPDQVAGDLEALLKELRAEKLLVPAGESDSVFPSAEASLPPDDGAPRPYTGLRLLTFRDMEDLLAFDPPLPGVPEQL